jgi:hypothetical protein
MVKFNVMVDHNTAIIKYLSLDDSVQKIYDNTHEKKIYFRNILLNPDKLISYYFPYEISEINLYPFDVINNKRKRDANLKHKMAGAILFITVYFLFIFSINNCN